MFRRPLLRETGLSLLLLVILLMPASLRPTSAANMTPLALTGFNADLVVENTAGQPPYYSSAVELNPNEGTAFYQSGLPGYSYGLPVDGTFTSATGDGTTFQLQSYVTNNALVLSRNTGIASGTLTLAKPAQFKRIALISNSASGGGTPELTLNFTDDSTFTSAYNAQDWFYNDDFALLGFERIYLANGRTEGAPGNPRFYQTTLQIDALPQISGKTLASITFNQAAGSGSTAIYAVSGEIAESIPAQITSQPADVTVLELNAAQFTAEVSGNPSPELRWYRNGQWLPEASGPSLLIPSVALTNNGALFQLVASNVVNGVSQVATSRAAKLTVLADTTPPALVRVYSLGLGQLLLNFSEKLTESTATNLSNYAVFSTNASLLITHAELDPSRTNVLLALQGLEEGISYTLAVSNLTDLAQARNIMAPTNQDFIASGYLPLSIGDPAPQGQLAVKEGGVELHADGAGLAGNSDSCYFACLPQTGDFDVKVRLDSLAGGDAWSEAGLMARTDPSPSSSFAAVVATPSLNGINFRARTSLGNKLTTVGTFPVNYPATWLRLKRTGSNFAGYASLEGQAWALLGTISLSAPDTMYLGFFVASRNTNLVATATFDEFAPVTAATERSTVPLETLGQCSRLTSLVISEIMYHPATPTGTNSNAKLEFIELFNSRPEPEDISGYRISGSVDYEFPAGTSIPGGGFLVVARSPADLEAHYGLHGVLGPWHGGETNGLPNSKGTVRLRHRTGAIFLEINYDSHWPWPIAADGAGHSLVLARPSLGEADPHAWAASATIGGTPGQWNPIPADPLDGVVINEVLPNPVPPEEDFIELFNHSARTIDLSDCFLTDDPATNKFRVPAGTSLAPGTFVAFYRAQLGFGLSSVGERLYLFNSEHTQVLNAFEFKQQEPGSSFGRSPDGSADVRRLAMATPAARNAAPSASPVVINEILFDPVSGNDDEQFVELFNRTESTISLADWRLSGAIDFTFPTGTAIAPRGFAVVARNAALTQARNPHLNATNCFGNFAGKLSHNGEALALEKPQAFLQTNSTGIVVTNIDFVTVNEFTYTPASAWSRWAEGGGSSLELIHPDADNHFAANWADSDETAKAPWTTITTTGTIDNGNVPADQLQVLLQGAGECLLDNVQVLDAAGNNRIANSDFAGSANGWTAQGTESGSSWESVPGSGGCYHVRAVERGDNQLNRIRTPLTSALAAGTQNVTIRADVRWLKGSAQIILRLRGNWLECFGQMAVPQNPGTPGLPNSRLVSQTAPPLADVTHSPVLPQAGEPFLVTARSSAAAQNGLLTLRYRIDPSTTYSVAAMHDDGTGGDRVANDGTFSATVPGQPAGTLVAFFIESRGEPQGPPLQVFPSDAPARECLVRVGEQQPAGSFPVYRLWMTQATLSTWNTRNKLNNTPLDVTFVLGNQRVIYNAQALFAGSPYIAPGYCGPDCGMCGYSIDVPADDLFLGERALVLDWPGGHGGESSAMQEQMGYFIADRLNLPYSHRYTIRLQVNGVTDADRLGVFEAVMQPAGKFIRAWSPQASDGQFFKIDRAFEFSDRGSLSADPQPRLQNFATTGGRKKTERYRWTFLYRSTERTDDYSGIFSLVDALNAVSPEPYTTSTYNLVDVEEWMRIFAAEHIIVNFDAYGHEIGKNMYAFHPEQGKWQLYMFDLDWLMLAAAQRGSGYSASSATLFNSEDPTITRMYNFPPFARAYWRAVQDAVNGPLKAEICNPVMDAKYRALVENGIQWCDGQPLQNPTPVKTWFSQRRNYLQGQLTRVESPFTINAPVLSGATVELSGTAPIAVESLWFNGIKRPLTWPDVRNWKTVIPLVPGTNEIHVVGFDPQGRIVPGVSNVIAVVYSGPPVVYPKTLFINEWMAENSSTLADPANGRYEDWFEVYNAGTNSVDLGGYFLSDSPDNPSLFEIPNNHHYVVPANGFLLVWADDLVTANTADTSELHVGFKLSKSGESIGLYAPDGAPLDEVTFAAQEADISAGRFRDGNTTISILTRPTPGQPNVLLSPPQVNGVTFDGTNLALHFEATDGIKYQLEYSATLGTGSWLSIGEPLVGTGAPAVLNAVVTNAPHGFFRLELVP